MCPMFFFERSNDAEIGGRAISVSHALLVNKIVCISVYVYLYIYIHTYIHIYI